MYHGALEGSILAENIESLLPRANNATHSGSGSEDRGGDLPMYYSYSVTVQQRSP
jgi:hypothetical protein